MNILFICHRFPFPPNRGGKIRPFQMIRHLAQNHSVTVASLAHSHKELVQGAGLKAHCREILAEVLPNSSRWYSAVVSLFSQTPSSLAYFSSRRLQSRIDATWSTQRFEAVIVHCAFMAAYALGLQGAFRLMDFGDLDSGKWYDYSRARSFPLSLGYGIEARKLRRFEIKAADEFNACSVTTEGEKEEFQTLGTSKSCSVIPNGVDADYFHPRSAVPPSEPVIVFLGHMDYYPNVDGICYFASEILPLIHKRNPGVKLRIVGSNPAARVRRLTELTGVEVTGFVPDVRPLVCDAMLAIAPLRLARGTQNKVLECMAMGIPVVSTAAAAKGIQAEPDRHLLIADGPEAFASQVLRLIEDDGLRKQLSQAGIQQVHEHHHWPNSMKILDRILEENVCHFSRTSDS
jgi:sugar transferase (PEP-CTERM/EpsH1 system associated)